MKYLLTVLAIILLLAETSCSTQRAISSYSGDGQIYAMPDWGVITGGGGYEVRFKCVRLDDRAHLIYHFTGLPKIAWHVDVYFAIEGPRDLEHSDGALAMSLKDADGRVILQFHRRLSELTWSGDGHGTQWLYDLDHSGFTADPTKHYVLDVTIEPGVALKDYDGYVLFRSGGHEGPSI